MNKNKFWTKWNFGYNAVWEFDKESGEKYNADIWDVTRYVTTHTQYMLNCINTN